MAEQDTRKRDGTHPPADAPSPEADTVVVDLAGIPGADSELVKVLPDGTVVIEDDE